MKTILRRLSPLLSAAWLWAASTAPAAEPAATIVERGPHHRIWHWTTPEDWPGGARLARQHRVVELATGMHYWAGDRWAESQELIEPFPDGAVARHGPHKAIFAPNLNTREAIDLEMPDGQRLRSHILGLAYTDSASARNVLIAEIKDCVGEILPPNQVLYRDAFNDIKATVRYTYTRAGLEQDVLLHQAPPSPAIFGLDPATTRLEVYTEFTDPPQAAKSTVILSQQTDLAVRPTLALPDFTDEALDFGSMHIGQGHAFPSGDDDALPVPTGKTWQLMENRQFLIEAVEYPAVRTYLETLPQAAVPNKARMEKIQRTAQRDRAPSQTAMLARHLPPGPTKRAGVKAAMRLAQAGPAPKAFVLDYQTLINSLTNHTFQSDTTYLISGTVNLYGSNNVLEGGCVIKLASGTTNKLCFYGSLQCQTTNYAPAVFTAKDDNTVGEIIGTGTPTNYYGDAVLTLSVNGADWDLHDLRFRYAKRGIVVNSSGGRSLALRHVQMGPGFRLLSVYASACTNRLQNVLFHDATAGCVYGGGSSTPIYAEHLTLRCVGWDLYGGTNHFVTNSLLVAVTNLGSFIGGYNATNSDPTGIFQTVGGGAHYLAPNSPYRNAGTTNISPNLAAELKRLTTYPPIFLSADITTDTTLNPQAGRDTDTPDLGAHFAPLDYLACGVNVASNVTVLATNGVAIGIDYSTNSWGFILNSARFFSEGSPVQLNRLVRAHTVQEQSGGNPGTRACFYDGSSLNASNELRLRHTEFTQLANDGYMLYTGQKFRALEWTHSRIYNPSLVIDTAGGNLLTCGVTNSLWWRGGCQFGLDSSSTNVTVHLRNNLYRLFSLHFIGGTTNWTVQDNLFDTMYLNENSSPVANSHNCYYLVTNVLSGGTSNQILTAIDYQAGPLGPYYYSTNPPGAGATNLFNLINAGSRNADQAGLYSFTATIDQARETNSPVDIGLHFAVFNQPPELTVPGAQTAAEDTSLPLSNLSIADPDADNGLLRVTLSVSHGTLRFGRTTGLLFVQGTNGAANLAVEGSLPSFNAALTNFSYLGTTNFYGSDSLLAVVNDLGSFGYGGPLAVTNAVALTVTPVNDPPIASSNSYTGAKTFPLTVSSPGVLVNGSDVEGEALTASLHTAPGQGSVILNSDGSFTYSPYVGFIGTDTFAYQAWDGAAFSDPAAVTLTITNVNGPSIGFITPTNGTSYAVGTPVPLTVHLESSGSSIACVRYYDGANLLGIVSTSPCSLTLDSLGTNTYTVQAWVVDNAGASNSASVTFTVDPDSDGDGVSDVEEQRNGTDPNDSYNDLMSNLSIVSGNNQIGPPGQVLPYPFVVRAGEADDRPRSNVLVHFAVSTGTAGLSSFPGSSSAGTNAALTAVTDGSGKVSVWYRMPSVSTSCNVISASVTSGSNHAHVTFVASTASPGTNAVAIAAGLQYSLALKADGTVVGWGYDGDGQATPPHGLTNVVAIAAQYRHSLALKSDGTVVGWGGNWSGQATPPVGLTNVVAITVGDIHSLALKSDGTVVGWGNNWCGRATPPDGLTNVVAIDAGSIHSLALKSDGTVVAWGCTGNGQTDVPIGLTNVVAIAAGDYHSLALKSDGTVVGWGSDLYGQSSPPDGLANVVAIVAGNLHSLALKSEGTVVGWGSDFYGESSAPDELATVVAIAAGAHSLALQSGAMVVGWGLDDHGQATPPEGLTNAVSASVFQIYTPLK